MDGVSVSPAPSREVLSWADFGVGARDLAGAVLREYRPDLVVAAAWSRPGRWPTRSASRRSAR